VDGSIEALGDGRTIKTEVRVLEVFDGRTVTVSKEDNIPSKFKAGLSTTTIQEILPNDEIESPLSLVSGDLEKAQQRLTEFTTRETKITRPENYGSIENSRLEETWGIQIPYTEIISDSVSSQNNSETEGIGDGKFLVRQYNSSQIDSTLSNFSVTIPTKINLELPRVLKDVVVDWEERKSISSSEFDASGLSGSFNSLAQRDTGAISSTLTLIPRFRIIMEETWGKNLDAEIVIFFLNKENLTASQIRSKANATQSWPKFSPQSFSATAFGYSETKTISLSISRAISFASNGATGHQPTTESQIDFSQSSYAVPLEIPTCITTKKNIVLKKSLENEEETIELSYPTVSTSNGETFAGPSIERIMEHEIEIDQTIEIPETPNQKTVPKTGRYLIDSSIEPYKFGWYLVRATVLNAASIG
jgi:hypothetical protein